MSAWGERDCSIQQHNQKLIEETPSPAISPAQRSALIERVTRAVSRVGYVNAGTLEFLLDGHGSYYFMEMNVRLQVEHAVTEMLTGVDIVKVADPPGGGGCCSTSPNRTSPFQAPPWSAGSTPPPRETVGMLPRARRPLGAVRHLSLERPHRLPLL